MTARVLAALGPGLAAIGAVAHPHQAPSASAQVAIIHDNAARWYAAHMVLMIGLALTILGLNRLLQLYRSRMASHGFAAAALGLVAMASFNGMEGLGGWTLARSSDRVVAVQSFHALTTSVAVNVPVFAAALLVPLGLGLLARAAHAEGDRAVSRLLATAMALFFLYMGSASMIVFAGAAATLAASLIVAIGHETNHDNRSFRIAG